MSVASGLVIRYRCTRVLARQRVRYKRNCKVLVVKSRCESCQSTCGQGDYLTTLLYLKVSSDGHATALASTSPSHALAKSWTGLWGHNCAASPHNEHWLPMAAKARPTGMLCLNASSTQLNAKLVCPFPFPSRSLCRLATIPALAISTRQELTAHLRVPLQHRVFPKVSCTFNWSKDASRGGAVARRARRRN